MAYGRRACDGDGGLGERRAVGCDETLPGGLAAERAGLGKGEVGKFERAPVGRALLFIRYRSLGTAEAGPQACGLERFGKLLAAKPDGCRLSRYPELVE